MHLPFTASWTWEPPHTASCNCLPGFLFPFHLVHRCLQPRMGCYPCSEARWKEKNDSLCQSDADSPSEKKYRSLPSYTLTPTSSSLISRASTVTEVGTSPLKSSPASSTITLCKDTVPYTTIYSLLGLQLDGTSFFLVQTRQIPLCFLQHES